MSKIKVSIKTKIIQFQYNNKGYTYKYEAGPNYGFAYIYVGTKKIYGPYQSDRTDEGIEVYNAFKEANIKF
jgi:hypothetical protein